MISVQLRPAPSWGFAKSVGQLEFRYNEDNTQHCMHYCVIFL